MQMFLMWTAAFGQTVFVVLWATRPWYRTLIGRALMTKGLALTLVLWFWIVGYYFPDHPYRGEIRDVLLAAVAVGIWAQVVAFVAEFYDARSVKRPPD